MLIDSRAEAVRIAAECNVEVLEEAVAASEKALGFAGPGLYGWLSVKDDDAVGKICGHDEIVLYDEGCLLGMHDESFNDSSGNDTLLGIKVSIKVLADLVLLG